MFPVGDCSCPCLISVVAIVGLILPLFLSIFKSFVLLKTSQVH